MSNSPVSVQDEYGDSITIEVGAHAGTVLLGADDVADWDGMVYTPAQALELARALVAAATSATAFLVA